MNKKADIRSLVYDELAKSVEFLGEKPFRASQIFEWIYQKGAAFFDDMKNLSKELREKLSQNFELKPFQVLNKEISKDGTTKFLFGLDDNEKIETVLIPTAKRTTACLSTQVGCKYGCKFCASGIGGFKRNLSTAEIITQVLHVKEEALRHKNPLSHVVYMGVGEPLDNLENVTKSIRIINDKRGLNIGARRITISTSGVIPKIMQLAKEGIQFELAVSLHGYDNKSRNILMPINKKYPFDDLMNACREYVKETNRQITFEYILIKDVTCIEKAANALKKAFKGLICKMNLISYNTIKEFDLQKPTEKEIKDFQHKLEECGIHSTLRASRGRDISGACGQLRHIT